MIPDLPGGLTMPGALAIHEITKLLPSAGALVGAAPILDSRKAALELEGLGPVAPPGFPLFPLKRNVPPTA